MKTKTNEMNELGMSKCELHKVKHFALNETVIMGDYPMVKLGKKLKAVTPMVGIGLLSAPTRILAEDAASAIDVDAFQTFITSWVSPITTILLFAIPLLTLAAALWVVAKYQLATERKKEEMQIETAIFKTVAVGALGLSISVILKIVGM